MNAPHVVDLSTNILKDLAHCAHGARDPSDPDPAMWCRQCGALRVDGTWQRSDLAIQADVAATDPRRLPVPLLSTCSTSSSTSAMADGKTIPTDHPVRSSGR